MKFKRRTDCEGISLYALIHMKKRRTQLFINSIWTEVIILKHYVREIFISFLFCFIYMV